jgi:four helix bundle protein
MFLNLKHHGLDVYKLSSSFVLECYRITRIFPNEEKFGMVSQIRRAALSVHLNIAEGASRRSAVERARYFEIARGSLIEIDAALTIAESLGYLRQEEDLKVIIELGPRCFQILSKLISANYTKKE